MSATLEIYGLTNVGLSRDHNEDYSALCFSTAQPNDWKFDPAGSGLGQQVTVSGSNCSVLIVADGMGGANAGEVASREAVGAIKNYLQNHPLTNDPRQVNQTLKASIKTAQARIVAQAAADPNKQGMGTTIVIACIFEDRVDVAWCGDSRAYILRNKHLYAPKQRESPHYPFTDDHSMVWENHMKNPKMMTAEDTRTHPDSNIITQSLGDSTNPPKPDFKSLPIQQDDKIMLCSDGLNGMIPDEGIAKIMNNSYNTEHACTQLVTKANDNGGHDNITALMATVVKGPKKAVPVKGKPQARKTQKMGLYILLALVLILSGLSSKLYLDRANKAEQVTQLSDSVQILSDSVQILKRTIESLIGGENSNGTTNQKQNTAPADQQNNSAAPKTESASGSTKKDTGKKEENKDSKDAVEVNGSEAGGEETSGGQPTRIDAVESESEGKLNLLGQESSQNEELIELANEILGSKFNCSKEIKTLKTNLNKNKNTPGCEEIKREKEEVIKQYDLQYQTIEENFIKWFTFTDANKSKIKAIKPNQQLNQIEAFVTSERQVQLKNQLAELKGFNQKCK